VGLGVSVAAVVLWVLEQTTPWWEVFEILTLPVKVALLVMPLWLLADLSGLLYRRPLVALGLGVSLIGATLLAAGAFLPWRSAYARHFNNDAVKQYYPEMPSEQTNMVKTDDYPAWLARWERKKPHAVEAGLLAAYYVLVLTPCAVFRLRWWSGAVVGLAGYGLLYLAPDRTGLIDWDYDVFLKGVVFDCISLDVSPIGFWFAGDHSIFFYGFMLIFFAGSAVCFAFAGNAQTKRQVHTEGTENTEGEGQAEC